jgi:hypothetical protein
MPDAFRHLPIQQRRFRYDTNAPVDRPSAQVGGSLLGLFRLRGETAARERRSEPRHEIAECRAWLGWKLWRGFRAPAALIVNISRGGALVFIDEPPAANRPVWIFLETPQVRTIIKAKALEVRTTNSGQCAVRLAFETPCPYCVFEAAVCGVSPADPKHRVRAAMTRVLPS